MFDMFYIMQQIDKRESMKQGNKKSESCTEIFDSKDTDLNFPKMTSTTKINTDTKSGTKNQLVALSLELELN